jgi:hypothetical protein
MGIVGVCLALPRTNRLIVRIRSDIDAEGIFRIEHHRIDMETGLGLRHLILQVDLQAISDIHVQSQRARLQLAGLDPAPTPVSYGLPCYARLTRWVVDLNLAISHQSSALSQKLHRAVLADG